MTGLEKIKEQILLEAKTASMEQLEKTKKEADQMIQSAKEKLKDQYIKESEEIEAGVEQMLARGISAANLKEKKMLLDAKQKMLQQIFDDAVDTMKNLSVKEYYDLLLHMVERYGLSESGIIHLSKKDLERMPDSFREEMKNRQIRISEQPERIDHGGFILSYGEIEENCTFEALLSANRENLQDKIVKIIF